MLGDTFTGKTSLVLRFAEGYYRESARGATVGAFFITKRLTVQGMTCKIQIWDTAGQEQFKMLAPMYYKNAAAAIICYDISSPRSFETMQFWVEELQRNVPAHGIVLALCATKCDLAVGSPDTRQAELLAQEVGAMFIKTSSKNNLYVTEMFEKVAEQVLYRQKHDGHAMPVTLATTSVETNDSKVPSTGNGYIVQPRTLSPTTFTDSDINNRLIDEKKQDDDDEVVDRVESKTSSVEPAGRCDANMLMCGDSDMLGGDNGQGCCIM